MKLGFCSFAAVLALATQPASAQVMPDMVSRTALRVCADPANMPFSNREGEGFENKIASIVADQLKLPLRYFWAPSGPGFVRNTLQSNLCDLIIGYAAGAEIVQHTNPYYRSTYAIVAAKNGAFADVASLDDPKLKGRHIGVFAATPPVDLLLAKGLMGGAKVYPLIVDHRFASPLNDMFADLKAGTIDVAVVWGPLAGYDAKKDDLTLTPLLKQGNDPDYSYRITFGIRHNEPDWKHKLEAVIRARQSDINVVLREYNVPLLDNAGHVLASSAEPLSEKKAP